MRPASRRERGVTLIELVVVIAIIFVVAALAWSSMERGRPRATLATATGELQAVIHAARLQALASGHQVAVVVFPAFANPEGGVGRVVVLEDVTFDFFDAKAAINLDDYNPARPARGATAPDLVVYDLPPGVAVGPAKGREGNALPKPWADVVVDRACSFCGDDRGAIRFDTRGRATFYPAADKPAAPTAGESLTLTSLPAVPGLRTLLVSASGGAVMTFSDG